MRSSCSIRDHLAQTSYDGITGVISFNSVGGNPGSPVLLTLKNRAWMRQ